MPIESGDIQEYFSMIVLAGGRSSRMGTDKSDLVYGDQTFLDIQIGKGRRLGIEDILVSGYQGTGCCGRVVADRFAQKGPLGGMEACLRQAARKRCLVLSVDVPLVTVPELRGLMEKNWQSDDLATILRHGEKQEPLIGVYNTRLADDMADALTKGNGSVFAFLKKLGYGIYDSPGEDFQFQNINEMGDYQKLISYYKFK